MTSAAVPIRPDGYTAEQFVSWQKHMGWRNARAASELSCNIQTISIYRRTGCMKKVMLQCRSLAVRFKKVDFIIKYKWEKA